MDKGTWHRADTVERSDYECPKCHHLTELLCVGLPVEIIGERCPRCRWQMDLTGAPRKVLYGSEIRATGRAIRNETGEE